MLGEKVSSLVVVKKSGLVQVFFLSVVLGTSLFLAYKTNGDANEIGFSFVLLDLVSQYVPAKALGLVTILSILVTIFSIFGLVRLFRKILEQRLVGIISASLGFGGSFLILLAMAPKFIFF